MHIFIPEEGQHLRLIEPWVINVSKKYKEECLRVFPARQLNIGELNLNWDTLVTIPPGVIIKIDKYRLNYWCPGLYIRIPKPLNPMLNGGRSLVYIYYKDLNNIKAEAVNF